MVNFGMTHNKFLRMLIPTQSFPSTFLSAIYFKFKDFTWEIT